MFKKILSLVVIAVLTFTFAGVCEFTVTDTYSTEMVVGEQIGDYSTEIEFFYETGNGAGLTSTVQSVYIPAGGSIIETVLTEIFSPISNISALSSFLTSGDVRYQGYEYSCGLITVFITADIASINDERSFVNFYYALANTLTGIDGVEYVSIHLNAQQEGISNLPVGILTHTESSATEIWTKYQAESASFNENSLPIEREAAIYFPSSNGQWLLPDVRSVTFANDNYAIQLMTELINGTTKGEAYSNFLSGGVSILSAAPQIHINSAGERILDVYLSGTLRDYMVLQSLPEWQLSGAITLTMCSFIPELDGVCIYIDGELTDVLNIRGYQKEFADGIMRRSDFSMFIGSTHTLYYGSQNGKLVGIQRAISSERAVSPYALITQLISGPSSEDGGAVNVMPVGISSCDLLGVSIKNGTATVNMSANFYRLCQLADEKQERMLVYSIVNTLCEMEGINKVRIVIEGEPIETLSDSIYLIGELMPNPGIIE